MEDIQSAPHVFVPCSIPIKFVVSQAKPYLKVKEVCNKIDKCDDDSQLFYLCEDLRNALREIFDLHSKEIENVA